MSPLQQLLEAAGAVSRRKGEAITRLRILLAALEGRPSESVSVLIGLYSFPRQYNFKLDYSRQGQLLLCTFL